MPDADAVRGRAQADADRRSGRRPARRCLATSWPTPTFFFQDEIAYDEKAFDKNLRKPGAAELLAKFRAALAAVEPFDVAAPGSGAAAFVAEQGIKTGDIIHAVRVATTGKALGAGCTTAWRSWAKRWCSSGSIGHWLEFLRSGVNWRD